MCSACLSHPQKLPQGRSHETVIGNEAMWTGRMTKPSEGALSVELKTQLRPLYKLLRFWRVGVEIYLSSIHPRQARN